MTTERENARELIRGAIQDIDDSKLIQVRADLLRELLHEPEIPEWREREKLFESRDEELSQLWHKGKIDDEKYASLRRNLREEFGYGDEPVQSVSAEDYVTMAEEPIEHRLRRAWTNGFKEGVDLGAFREGEWDHR